MLPLIIALQLTASMLVNTNYLTVEKQAPKQSVEQVVKDDKKLVNDISKLINIFLKEVK